jgi:hypothetical protein
MHAVSLRHGVRSLLGVRAGADVDASPRLAFTLYVIMPRSISVKRKSSTTRVTGKPGRPATGTEPLYGVRIGDNLIAQILEWAKANGGVSRSEAIRRLVEIGLSKPSDRPQVLSTSEEGAARAAELTGKIVDRQKRR